jgi:hypothetical protein
MSIATSGDTSGEAAVGSKLITAVMMELAAAAVLRQWGGLVPSEKSAAGVSGGATDAGSQYMAVFEAC